MLPSRYIVNHTRYIMKNIKNFRAFFEGKENGYSNSSFIYIKTVLDDYGMPCLSIDEDEPGIKDVISEEELIDDNKHSKLMEIENKISIINNSIVNLEKNLFSEKNIDSIKYSDNNNV